MMLVKRKQKVIIAVLSAVLIAAPVMAAATVGNSTLGQTMQVKEGSSDTMEKGMGSLVLQELTSTSVTQTTTQNTEKGLFKRLKKAIRDYGIKKTSKFDQSKYEGRINY